MFGRVVAHHTTETLQYTKHLCIYIHQELANVYLQGGSWGEVDDRQALDRVVADQVVVQGLVHPLAQVQQRLRVTCRWLHTLHPLAPACHMPQVTVAVTSV